MMRRNRDVGEGIIRPHLSVPGRVGLIVLALFGLLPVYWLTATAFTKKEDVFAQNRPFFPVDPTIENFVGFFQNDALLKNLGNSIIVSSGTALLAVLVGGLMAYSLSKFRYRGRNAIMFMFLIGQLIPGALLLISLYLMLSSAGLLYTYAALILSFTTFTLPPGRHPRGREGRRALPDRHRVPDRLPPGRPRAHHRRDVRLHARVERPAVRADARRSRQADAARGPDTGVHP
jgi:ABC-type Fe3+ transport system permease subunit